MEKDTIISIRDLLFSYSQHQKNPTVNHLSLEIYRGEWISIIGHNGSGKSTTVRLLDGLLEADSGQIVVDGVELTEDSVWDIRHKIGMVFQNPDNQFVGATVEDDVAFGLENKGVPYEEMKKRVAQALEVVGMSEFKSREPARLSGGQKQRVAIAGVVAMEPDIIVLDEATSMLDPEGRIELIQTIREIKHHYPITVLSITHDLEEVSMSDRVVVMKNGEIESISTPRELFARGEELLKLGLDMPFSSHLLKKLQEEGLLKDYSYLTEEELEGLLWEFISNK